MNKRGKSARWLQPPRALIAASMLAAFLLFSNATAVLGPEGTYFESNGDIIEVCQALDASFNCVGPTNTYANGDTVYVRVQTTRVTNRNGSGTALRLRNHVNTQVGTTGSWTQRSAVSPYVYTAQVTIPASNTNTLKLDGDVVSTAGPRVVFEESIDIPSINRYMHVFSDAALTDESYTFRPGATMYISAYGSGSTYSAGQTGTNNRLYNFANSSVNNWPAPAVIQNGNWYDFQLTVPAAGLTDGDWYWIRGFLRNGGGGTIMRNSRMIQIDGSDPTASFTSPADGARVGGTVPVTGTADDTISFYSYLLEYGAGASPSSWTPVGSTMYTPVIGGTLQSWDTAVLADGIYTLRLTVADRAYNFTQVTRQVNVDNTPPVITDVGAGPIGGTTAIINWTTDEAADSQVEYGTTTSYGSTTPLDPSLVTAHSVPVSGLTEDTEYHYRVITTDEAGNQSASPDYVFRTATVLVIQPGPVDSRDTYLKNLQPAWNNGAQQYMVAGDLANASFGTMRSTLRFDLSSIPSGSTIQSATLSLYQFWQGDTSTPMMDIHYLSRDWTQGTGIDAATGDGATWDTYDGANAWTAPGGDYNAAASASAMAPNSTAAWVNWDLTALTQSWVDGSVTNYGMLMKQDVENLFGWDAKAFISSDYGASPALRPKLTIEYIPVVETLTLSIDETYNRDGSDGAGSVGFGNVTAGFAYEVGDGVVPPYAVRLTVSSNAAWGLKVSASDDLKQLNPANFIGIANLQWKQDAEDVTQYKDMVKDPSETVIVSGMPPSAGTSYWFDYRLTLPVLAVSGSYSTPVVYTAYPS